MTLYTIQVSNHPKADVTPASEAAAASWVTRYDGPLKYKNDARLAAKELSQWFRHVRVFRGAGPLGRLWLQISNPWGKK